MIGKRDLTDEVMAKQEMGCEGREAAITILFSWKAQYHLTLYKELHSCLHCQVSLLEENTLKK